jgi:hypothetical protein
MMFGKNPKSFFNYYSKRKRSARDLHKIVHQILLRALDKKNTLQIATNRFCRPKNKSLFTSQEFEK